MKKLIIFVSFACLLVFQGCGSTTAKEEYGVLLRVRDVAGKTLPEVQRVLGRPVKTEKVKGYPCAKSDCIRAIFHKGKYEVIFREGRADRITISMAPDLTYLKDAITVLGLPASEPTFMKEGVVNRWKGVHGLEEVNFAKNFILIQVSESDGR